MMNWVLVAVEFSKQRLFLKNNLFIIRTIAYVKFD